MGFVRESGLNMGIITRYVCWVGHDAGGMLPPVDVVAGILAPGVCPSLPAAPCDDDDELLVVVPPQWIGDWTTGYRLAPGYQHVWRVPASRLRPRPATPRFGPYRPAVLPVTASGPRRTRRAAASG